MAKDIEGIIDYSCKLFDIYKLGKKIIPRLKKYISVQWHYRKLIKENHQLLIEIN